MPRLIAALALALLAASAHSREPPTRPWFAAEHLTAAIAREPADTLPPLPQTAVARATLADRAAATLAAMRYWQPRAAAGDAATQYRLGQYHSRQGDHQTAQAWFRKAAAQGDPRAYIALALHRLAPLQKINNGAYNSTLAEEYDAASAWLELAIDTNRSAVAEYWRGCINHKRDPDADTAGAYWYAAAAQNYLPAMLNLQRYDDPYWLTRAIRTDPEHLLLRRELRQLADPGQNTALSTGSACYRFDTDNLLAYVLTEADQWPEKPPQQQCRADIPADDSDDTPAITATDTWQNTYTAAIRGDAAAQYRLGQTYARGDGVRPDPDETRKWHSKATAQQLPDAQTALGILAWQSGDTDSTRENLNRAAAANHPDARYWLGQLAHAQGDETAATAYWQRAAAQNHAGAMRELGNQQARQGDQQNARDWWQRAAETNPPDAQAMYHLGQSLLAENRDAARRWWQQASEHGHGWASWYLASSYAMPDALGLPQDGAKAWQYARRAAAQGNRDAAKLLMALAAASCGTPHAYAHPQSPYDRPINHWHARYQDENHWRQTARLAPLASLPATARPTNTTTPPQRLIPDPLPQEYRAAETAAHTVAARYWQHRAAAGDAEAQYQLGQHYALGAGVPLDPAAARVWYSKAAKAKNDRLAQDWYRHAAAGGNNIAMRHLADSYRDRDRYSDADHSDALGQYWQTQATQGHHPDPETLYWLGARDRNSGSYAAPATPKKNRARALIQLASDLGSGLASDDLARESRHGYHRQPQNETLADYYDLKAENQGFPFLPGELDPARYLFGQHNWLRLKQRSGLPALQQNLRALWHY